MAGGSTPASAATAAIRETGARSTRICGEPAEITIAAAVAASSPAASSVATISGRYFTPIKITSVVRVRAIAAQSNSERSSVGGTCPLTMVTPCDKPRWVTGMPASAGAASAELTPGITCTLTPAAAQASASSPPRPNR